ncbi:MAG: aspartate ammonia-lyase [Erysipelotrichaceae bacterium]|nr:aspartate ammonia-lyase [Erysipelotrichaceae bacterium]
MKRVEKDFLGTLEIDKDALYGIHSLRANLNFPITKRGMDPLFIRNMALVKKASALTNKDNGDLEEKKADAIIDACDQIIAGRHLDSFIVDLIQGGAGTSANMNANEVIANLAILKLGGKPGEYSIISPLDHVNMHQSTNDVVPTAARLTVMDKSKDLINALSYLKEELDKKALQYKDLYRLGRTQLQDAVPMKASRSFEAYSSMIRRSIVKIENVLKYMRHVNLGGTAIGSGIASNKYYHDNVVGKLAELSGYELSQFYNLYDGTQNADDFASVSAEIRVCALSLSKMANDLRLLSSGPLSGYGEYRLPAKQSGSSIMPGKVNPVIPETLNQAAFLVIGNDVTVMMAAEAGQLELNAFLPVLLFQLFESIDVLSNSINTFTDNCIKDLLINEEKCAYNVEHSASLATALIPIIGYDKACEIVKKARETGKTVFEIAQDYGILRKQIEDLLNPLD